jgi:tetratricopeptide (TPR) repeat protein
MAVNDFESVSLNRESIDAVLTEETDPEKLFSLGLSCYRQKKLPEARRLFSRACDLKPEEPRYASYCGLLLALVMRKLKEAQKLCEGAIKPDCTAVELFYNLGRVYLMQGNREKALHAFRKGLQIDPDNAVIHRELENVGTRKKPFFKSLSRNNPLNRLAGMLRSKLYKHNPVDVYTPSKIVR